MKHFSMVGRRRARQGYYGSARLDARASVPPLTRPPPPGILPLGFHRGNLSLRGGLAAYARLLAFEVLADDLRGGVAAATETC